VRLVNSACRINQARLSVGVNGDIRENAVGDGDLFVTNAAASPAFNFHG
jgi:hypothetical protein